MEDRDHLQNGHHYAFINSVVMERAKKLQNNAKFHCVGVFFVTRHGLLIVMNITSLGMD